MIEEGAPNGQPIEVLGSFSFDTVNFTRDWRIFKESLRLRRSASLVECFLNLRMQ